MARPTPTLAKTPSMPSASATATSASGGEAAERDAGIGGPSGVAQWWRDDRAACASRSVDPDIAEAARAQSDREGEVRTRRHGRGPAPRGRRRRRRRSRRSRRGHGGAFRCRGSRQPTRPGRPSRSRRLVGGPGRGAVQLRGGRAARQSRRPRPAHRMRRPAPSASAASTWIVPSSSRSRPWPPESTTPASARMGSSCGVRSTDRAAASIATVEHGLDVAPPLGCDRRRVSGIADDREDRALDRASARTHTPTRTRAAAPPRGRRRSRGAGRRRRRSCRG